LYNDHITTARAPIEFHDAGAAEVLDLGMIAPGAHGALGDRTGHGRGLGRSILLDHKKPSSMRSLGLDPCVGFWSLAVLFRRPVDVEWGPMGLLPILRIHRNQAGFRHLLFDAGPGFKALHVAVPF